ncbi:MAG TPA: hypothetical protein VIR26_08305 [Metalysinibacillus sp.]
MFDLKKFLMEALFLSYQEGSLGEGQVKLTAIQYLSKGMLTDSDLNHLDELIKEEKLRVKAEKEKAETEDYPETDDEIGSE